MGNSAVNQAEQRLGFDSEIKYHALDVSVKAIALI